MNNQRIHSHVPNIPDTVVLSVRLKGAEAVRYVHILEAAFQRNPYIDKSHAIRELLGLDEPAVLTEKEINFFRTGVREEKHSGAPVAHEANHPLSIQRSPARKRKTG
jgi:hypothetical protein